MINFFTKKNVQLDFIIVGTQKGGTSALAYYLRKHEDIEMPGKKELHFFDNNEHFENDKVNYKDLNRYFGKRKDRGKIYGEATPIYMYWDKAMQRIYNHNSKVKIIAILRNPIERAFSHWNMEVRKEKENRDFFTCISQEIRDLKNGGKAQHRTFSYVDRGLYANQIEKIYELFPQEQVLFMKYDTFLSSQSKALKVVFKFLKVPAEGYKFERKTLNKIEYSSTIKESETTLLREFYLEDIEKIESLLNWDCKNWKST